MPDLDVGSSRGRIRWPGRTGRWSAAAVTLVRTCWWASALLLILLGSTVAVLALPVADVLLRVVAGFLVGLTGALVLRDLVGPQFGPPTPGSAGAVGA